MVMDASRLMLMDGMSATHAIAKILFYSFHPKQTKFFFRRHCGLDPSFGVSFLCNITVYRWPFSHSIILANTEVDAIKQRCCFSYLSMISRRAGTNQKHSFSDDVIEFICHRKIKDNRALLD